jgi:hypothetical protein
LLLFASIVSWSVVLLRHIYLFFLTWKSTNAKETVPKLFFIPVFFQTALLLVIRFSQAGLPGVAPRLGVNLLYFVQLIFTALYSDRYQPLEKDWLYLLVASAYWVAACMFGVAALLYGIAGARRHPLVSSKLLGGTGIEPMVLTLHGLGPSHQSVGDEAREGAIRL